MEARRVLLIEDEASAREALESLLLEEGYLVRTASSGRSGLQAFLDFAPDVVLCDYYLPDVDGLQVLRVVRANAGAAVQFILLTAGLGGVEGERALRAEADAFLTKPVDLNQLHRVLKSSTDLGQVLHATIAKGSSHA
jgi:two-component system nitrogen regulation response regulator NtrX